MLSRLVGIQIGLTQCEKRVNLFITRITIFLKALTDTQVSRLLTEIAGFAHTSDRTIASKVFFFSFSDRRQTILPRVFGSLNTGDRHFFLKL